MLIERHKISWHSAFIAIIIFIITFGGGFYFGSIFQEAKILTKARSNFPASRTTTLTEFPSNQGNWKFYRNQKFSYQLAYPAEWFVRDMFPYPNKKSDLESEQVIVFSEKQLRGSYTSDGGLTSEVSDSWSESEKSFMISSIRNINRLTPNEWIRMHYTDIPAQVVSKKINFGSNEFYWVTWEGIGGYEEYLYFTPNTVLSVKIHPKLFQSTVFSDAMSTMSAKNQN